MLNSLRVVLSSQVVSVLLLLWLVAAMIGMNLIRLRFLSKLMAQLHRIWHLTHGDFHLDILNQMFKVRFLFCDDYCLCYEQKTEILTFKCRTRSSLRTK